MSPAARARELAGVEVRDRNLERLAEDVRRHHKAVERHARSMLDEAIAAGEKLIEAKGLLRHGEFGPWIAYCGVSRRSASLYMKLAREKGNVAVLEADSIRQALEALGGKRRKPKWRELEEPVPRHPGHWQVVAWREAMAAQGRRGVFSYSIEAGEDDRRRCFTTVEAEAYDRKTADSAVETLAYLDEGES